METSLLVLLIILLSAFFVSANLLSQATSYIEEPDTILPGKNTQRILTSMNEVIITSSNTTIYRTPPTITSLKYGGLVGCWATKDYISTSSGDDVVCRIYNALGAPLDINFGVSSDPSNEETDPKVAPLEDGGFVVAFRTAANPKRVIFRIFESNGTPRTNDIDANDGDDHDKNGLCITGLKNGNFLIAWAYYGSPKGVYGRIFDPNGNSVTSEFRVNTLVADVYYNTSCIGLSDGTFVVAWVGENIQTLANTWFVRLQRFSKYGIKMGDEYSVDPGTGSKQGNPYLLDMPDSKFLVLWQNPYDSNDDVHGARVSYTGTVEDKFKVNKFENNFQGHMTAARLADGGFIVTWSSQNQLPDNKKFDVFARAFDSNWQKIGSDEFVINTITDENQYFPAVASFGAGFAVLFLNTFPSSQNYYIRFFNSLTGESCPSSPCTDPYSKCDTTTGICYECDTNGDCGNPNKPRCASGVCAGCTSDSDCPYTDKSHCNTTSGACSECTVNHPCNEGFKCDFDNNICVSCEGSCSNECNVNSDCLTPPKLFCSLGHICVECMKNSDCGTGKTCDVAQAKCVGSTPTPPPSTNTTNPNPSNPNPTPKPSQQTKKTINVTAITVEEVPESTKEAFAVMGNAVGASTAAASVPVIASNPALLWGFVKLLQGFFYFLFFNVQYPANVKAFLEICNLGTFDFAPSLFDNIQFSLPAPPHFFQNGYSGFFLSTAGSALTIWIGVLALTGLVVLLQKILSGRISGKLNIVKKLLLDQMKQLWESSFIEMLYAALLQIKVYKFVEGPAIPSIMVAGGVVLVAVVYGVCLFQEIWRKPKSYPPAKKWKEFSEYTQRFLHPFCMIFLYQFPFQQISALWTLNSMHLMVLFAGGIRNHRIAFFNECAYFVMHVLTSYLVYDDFKPERKDSIGWAIIAICVTVIAVDVLAMLFEGIRKAYRIIVLLNAPKKPLKKTKLNLDTAMDTSHGHLITTGAQDTSGNIEIPEYKRARKYSRTDSLEQAEAAVVGLDVETMKSLSKVGKAVAYSKLPTPKPVRKSNN